MNKQEFLAKLRKGLSGLSQSEIEERVAFYSEVIDDRMEEGISEEEAVREIGSVDDIVSQILAENASPKTERKMRAWEVALLVLGSPVWLSLLIAALAVVFSVYVAMWSVILSLWAIFVAVVSCIFGSVVATVFCFVFYKNQLAGLVMLSAGIVCIGLSIFFFFGCKAATEGAIWLTKKCFGRKEKKNA